MYIVNVQGAILKGMHLAFYHWSGEGIAYDVLERTLKREIEEEIGVQVKDQLKYVHSSCFVSNRGNPVLDVVFLCKYGEGLAYAKSCEEVDDVLWMTSEEVMNHPKSPSWLKESFKRIEGLLTGNAD